MAKSAAKSKTTLDLLDQTPKKSSAQLIEERRSQELVIALVGPVGSGVSTAAKYLLDILQNDFRYRVRPILKLSDIIRAEARRVQINSVKNTPLDEYISTMQTAGNLLREKFGGSYLVEKAIESIVKFRKENGGVSDGGVPIPSRHAFIIDSLKNLEELKLLRQVYGKTLCVVGVFAPDQLRKQRLETAFVPETSIKKIMDRDQNEVATFGQNTRKLFVESDLFICNDKKPDELERKIRRFLDIIFNVGVHTPNRAESAMYEAASAAAQSGCMSRQVGASIVSAQGELIAVGRNDVPRRGGGLYVEDDQSKWDETKRAIVDNDHRCFKWKNGICHNESRLKDIITKIAQKIWSGEVLKKDKTLANIIELLQGTEVDDLTEFSRSIHAEMEAILSVAREGRHSLVGATLYTSTYPCHNCARHIVAAGIDRVVYIEPYKKSQAISLHSDSVTEDPDDHSRVIFSQYDGVAPRNYHHLFRPEQPRKKDGCAVNRLPEFAIPVFSEPLDSRTDYEAKFIAVLCSIEHTV
jgi:deoxycytidylate deaminase